jgi:hypothetical protein
MANFLAGSLPTSMAFELLFLNVLCFWVMFLFLFTCVFCAPFCFFSFLFLCFFSSLFYSNFAFPYISSLCLRFFFFSSLFLSYFFLLYFCASLFFLFFSIFAFLPFYFYFSSHSSSQWPRTSPPTSSVNPEEGCFKFEQIGLSSNKQF